MSSIGREADRQIAQQRGYDEGYRAGFAAAREAAAKVAGNASVIYFAETMGRNSASDTAARICKAIRALQPTEEPK